MLHTRVSEALDEELKQRAADLGMSVSNLVRNVLANTTDMVEEIVQDATQVADEARQSAEQFASELRSRAKQASAWSESAVDEARQSAEQFASELRARAGQPPPRQPRTGQPRVGWVTPAVQDRARQPELLGWQELTLARNALCDRCNDILPLGTDAAVAVYDEPGKKTFLCLSCLSELREDDETEASPDDETEASPDDETEASPDDETKASPEEKDDASPGQE